MQCSDSTPWKGEADYSQSSAAVTKLPSFKTTRMGLHDRGESLVGDPRDQDDTDWDWGTIELWKVITKPRKTS